MVGCEGRVRLHVVLPLVRLRNALLTSLLFAGLALELETDGRLLPRDTVDLAMTGTRPTVPVDIVRLTVWALREFRVVEWMHDVQGLQVRLVWQDLR